MPCNEWRVREQVQQEVLSYSYFSSAQCLPVCSDIHYLTFLEYYDIHRKALHLVSTLLPFSYRFLPIPPRLVCIYIAPSGWPDQTSLIQQRPHKT